MTHFNNKVILVCHEVKITKKIPKVLRFHYISEILLRHNIIKKFLLKIDTLFQQQNNHFHYIGQT